MPDLAGLKEKLKQLRLTAMAQNLDIIIAEANRKNQAIITTVERLADLELEQRWLASIAHRYRQSRLRDKPTIDQFDAEHHPSRAQQKNRISNLIGLEFIRNHADVIIIGNPGTGKTFLAKCIAYAACNANYKVLFTTAIDMINHLLAAEADRSLLKKLHEYQSPDLLVLDELGYLALGPSGSHLFFQVISERHQVKSTLVTTNLPFADWGKVFDNTTTATAIADRLVQDAEVIIMEGESYRRKKKRR